MKKNLLYTLLAFLFALQASAQNKASYTYDANNQLTQVVYANGTTVKYTYDALGNRLSKKVTTVQQQYTITLTASPVEGGKVTGAGTYYDGTTITIKATANEGYAFERWSDGDTNASRTIVANKNYTLIAYFTKKEATKQYTVTLTASPTEGGSVTGGGTYDEGETIQIKAIANTGYKFSKWSDNNTSETRNITVVNNYSLTAYFEQNPGGSTQPTGTTLDATDIGETSATLRANINTTGIYSAWAFQYGKTTSYGESTSIRAIAAGLEGAYQYNFTVSNLEPNTTYHYRVLVTLTGGQTLYGQDMTFTTTGAPVEQDGILGDVNNDGVVNKEDIRQIKHAYIGIDVDTSRCDVDNDGKISVADVALVIAIANGTYDGGDNPQPDSHEYVDLGLPSGKLWATCNIGANSPEEYGDYFAWGDTTGYGKDVSDGHFFDWEHYKWCNGTDTSINKYCVDAYFGTVDNLTELEPNDDAAYVNWGSNWRMPTLVDLEELINNCDWTWTKINGNYGCIVSSKVNNNSIFLPAAGRRYNDKYQWGNEYGCYYISTLSAHGSSSEDGLFFGNYGPGVSTSNRCCGSTIRPVYVDATIDPGSTPDPDPEPETPSVIQLNTKPTFYNSNNEEVSKLAVGQTYKLKFQIIHTGDKVWEGEIHMKESSEVVKQWTGEYFDPGDRANLTYTFTPQSAGRMSYYVYYQTDGTDKEHRIDAGNFELPIEIEVVNSGSGNGSYLGHDYVDLGLPSGTLWASCNLGASQPEGLGLHYAWGETIGCDVKEEFLSKNYKYYDYSSQMFTKYFVESSSETAHGYVDGITILQPADDAATVNWGGNWRMPTYKERDELLNELYTKWTLTTINGVSGYKVESIVPGYEGKSIFMPIAGYCSGANKEYKVGERSYYLTSSLYTSDPQYAHHLNLTPTRPSKGNTSRSQGSSVRAVVSRSDLR